MIFAKCDVDDCQQVAEKHNISAMPTFLIFQDKKEVKRIRGANIPELSQAVQGLVEQSKKMTGSDAASGSASGPSNSAVWWGAPLAKGYVNITEEIEKTGVDIMNASSEAGPARCLFESSQPGKDPEYVKDWVESDTDEQLMIFIPFRSTLKLHSIHITSLPKSGDDEEEEIKRPKKLKLYVNRPNIVGFEETDGITPTQEVEIAPDSWDKKTGTAVINTRFVKFQSVFSLTIFVDEGEDGCEKTRIDRIRVVGEAGEKRDMGKLEKVKDGHE
ncbi:PITH domain-containing protein [Kalaharituber pfeilii]|nr:PITH domain-containing protein [Kalaharituber pfeilii]